MIIVTGHAMARQDTELAVQQLALEHVQRSRTEPGCLSHEVSRDVEHPLRFTFVERWADMAALQAHFRLDASRQFVRSLTQLCAAPPQMALYQAEAIDTGR